MAMTTRRTSALPIPQAELDRMRTQLASSYGSQVWEGAGARILIVRVPRAEPDLVTDIEAAVDYLEPAQTEGLTAALLVGDAKAHAVPTHPFADLMQRRLQMDADQGRELRKRLAPGTHLTYRAPGDHRKTIRLALRLRSPTVAALGEEELERWSLSLGADLQAGKLAGVRAVHLVADQDDVRLGADLFLQGIRQRLADAEERRTMAQALAAKQADVPRPAPSPRSAALPPTHRVAYAPLRSIGDAAPRLDAEGGPARFAAEDAAAHGDGDAPRNQAPPAAPPENPLIDALKGRLAEAGFDVLVAPPTKHLIDLAAERSDGDVQRVIVRVPERLTAAVAQEILATCRAVETDLALVVCQDADPEGRKRLIATKARWVRPEDVPLLNF